MQIHFQNLVSDRYDNKSVTIISYAYGPGQFYNHDDNGDRIDLNTVTIGNDLISLFSIKCFKCSVRLSQPLMLSLIFQFDFSILMFFLYHFIQFQIKISNILRRSVRIMRRTAEMMWEYLHEVRTVTCCRELWNKIIFLMFVRMQLVLGQKTHPIDAKKVLRDKVIPM